MIQRNTDNFTGFIIQDTEKVYFHAQDKIFYFISKGAGIFAGLMKQDLKSPDHFLYGYIADGYQLALYTGYEERKVSVNYKLRPGIYIVSRANACQYDMTKFQAVEFIGGRTGVHSSLPADLRVHFKPWYPGTAWFLLKWCRRQDGKRTTPL